ncbi:MAG: DNA cytosine methyltransferase [Moorellales bacterium]
MPQVSVLFCGMPVPEEFPDGHVRGVWRRGEAAALWYSDGNGSAGVVSVDAETFERLRASGVPEIPSLGPAFREIGFDPQSVGLEPGEDPAYVYIRRRGEVFSDEFLSWYQVDGVVCYLEEVKAQLPDLPERWLEVRLPWQLDLQAAWDAFASAGWGISRLDGYPGIVAVREGKPVIAGRFPQGGSYCLLPIPGEAEDAGVWAAAEGAEAFRSVWAVLKGACRERIDHGLLADPGAHAVWQAAGAVWEAQRPVAVELFAGGGGSLIGNLMAGFDVRVAVEIDKWACETLRRNFPGLAVLEKDIRQVTADEIRQYAGEEIDYVFGGPPCQGYSMAGKRLIDDPRNTLYREFVRLVRELRPKVVGFENVAGLLTMKHATGNWAVEDIYEDFSSLGYGMDLKLLDAVNYDVPQRRKRVIFHGIRRDVGVKISWPGPSALSAEEILTAERFGLEVAPGESLESEAEPGDLVFVTPAGGESYFARCVGRRGERYRAVYDVVDFWGRRRTVNCWNVLSYPGRRDPEQLERLLKFGKEGGRSKDAVSQLSLFGDDDGWPPASASRTKYEVFDLLVGAADPWRLAWKKADRWGWIEAMFEHSQPHATGARARVYCKICTSPRQDDSAQVRAYVQTAVGTDRETVTLNTYGFGERCGQAAFEAFFKPSLFDRLFARDAVLCLLYPEAHAWSHILVSALAGHYARVLGEDPAIRTVADLLVFRALGLKGRSGPADCTYPWVHRDETGRRNLRSTRVARLIDPGLSAAVRVLGPEQRWLGEMAEYAAQVAVAQLLFDQEFEPWPGIEMPERMLRFRPYRTVWDAIGDLPEVRPGERCQPQGREGSKEEQPRQLVLFGDPGGVAAVEAPAPERRGPRPPRRLRKQEAEGGQLCLFASHYGC